MFFFITSVVLALTLNNYVLCQTAITEVGTFIGFVDSAIFDGTQRQVVKYIGIPYGEPTDGENRFSEPKPRQQLTEPYIANRTDLPNICPQLIGGYIKAESTEGRVSEDCLYLSIYAPANTKDDPESQSYPVMIWIHGGSFVAGLSDQYPGDILSSFNDVIVVSINYRLNVFGFFSTGDEHALGNYGLWDQRLAIEWVHNHIKHFGGDPNEVTLFGGSSGSDSAVYHAMYPGNRGLFKRVIAESGTPRRHAPSNMLPFAAFAGCNQTSSLEVLSCLRSMSWEALSAKAEDSQAPAYFTPVVDGKFIKKTAQEILADPQSEEMQFYSTIDIIFGVNNLEGAMFMLPMFGKLAGVKDEDISWIALNVTHEMPIPKLLWEETILPSILMKRYFPGGAPDIVKDAISSKYSDWNDPNEPTNIRDMLMDLIGDKEFSVPTVEAANAHTLAVATSGSQKNTFFYQYTFLSEIFDARPQWLKKGADHADEILCVFGFSDKQELFTKYHVSSYTPTPSDIKMSTILMKYWSNFAKTGNPNSPTQVEQWPAFSMDNREFLQFTSSTPSFTSAERNFGEPRVSFWLEIIPSLIGGVSTSPVTTETTTVPEKKPFSARLNIDSVTAENIIIALSVISGVLLICILMFAFVAIVSYKRNSRSEVIGQPSKIV